MHREVLTVVSAAALMDCHPRTVQRHAICGDWPAARIGRSWRLWQPSVVAFLQGDPMPVSPAASEAERDYLLLAQFADRMGLTRQTVQSLVSSGHVPAKRAGTRWMVSWSDAVAYIGVRHPGGARLAGWGDACRPGPVRARAEGDR